MKFVDIIKALLIVVILDYYFFHQLQINSRYKRQLEEYRCSFSYALSYLGYDTMENFSYCVGNIQRFDGIFFITSTIYFRKYGG